MAEKPSTESSLDTRDNKASQTTAEQDLKSAGQRHINLIWESNQARIALIVVVANVLYVFAVPFLPKNDPSGGTLLANAFFLVIGFYFGRTNHARVGDAPDK